MAESVQKGTYHPVKCLTWNSSKKNLHADATEGNDPGGIEICIEDLSQGYDDKKDLRKDKSAKGKICSDKISVFSKKGKEACTPKIAEICTLPVLITIYDIEELRR